MDPEKREKKLVTNKKAHLKHEIQFTEGAVVDLIFGQAFQCLQEPFQRVSDQEHRTYHEHDQEDTDRRSPTEVEYRHCLVEIQPEVDG